MPLGITAIGADDAGKAVLVVNLSKDLTAKCNAGKIIQEIAPLIGGHSGGKPDAAQAGGPSASGLADALAKAAASLVAGA
jgi:alanyl-tRNA synthetase